MNESVEYVSSPTCGEFHRSNARVRGLMGPVGSGKSVACVMEIMRRVQEQEENADGVRKTRVAVVRNTTPELKTTTLNTWKDWVPESMGRIVYSSPIRCELRFGLPDGTNVESDVHFMPLDKPNDVRKLLSFELTFAWLNEVRELPKEVFDGLTMRIPRYPKTSGGDVGASWHGIIMDTNPPDDSHWYYKLSEETKPEGWRFFRQPPVFLFDPKTGIYTDNPIAENVRHHKTGFSYWREMLKGKDPEWVKVYVLGQYGSLFDGRPIFQGYFNEDIHVSKEPLEVYRGMPLYLGWDFGLTPSCVVAQASPNGQLRILREYVSARSGIKAFAKDVVLPALRNDFHGMALRSYGDPAGSQGSQVDHEQTCFGMLEMAGIPTDSAGTNDPQARIQAVIDYLTRMVDGAPGLILDPKVPFLRKGFNGMYRYNRVRSGGDSLRFHEQPEKNEYSHPHDALQYLVLGVNGSVRSERRRTDFVSRKSHRVAWEGAC